MAAQGLCEHLYQVIWQPMLEGMFGSFYKEVHHAWFWRA
jgi:hypothetical protein